MMVSLELVVVVVLVMMMMVMTMSTQVPEDYYQRSMMERA